MAPRRVVGNVKACNSVNYNKLSVDDVLCPICRSILIEPVTLPCNHGFCASCFQGTMENANLVCPLCRIRIGSWLRSAKRKKTLINEAFWKAINDFFPQQIKNKLDGIDENLQDAQPIVRISSPGEIRKEYEIQKQKEDEIYRMKHEKDLKASEELIMKLKQEEEFQQAVMEEKLKLDEQVAKKLAEELSFNSPSTSKMGAIPKGPLDKFLKSDKPGNNLESKEYTCRILCMDKDKKPTQAKTNVACDSPVAVKKKLQPIQKILETEISSDSSDSIESECRYFKPIDYRHNPPSEGKSPLKVPTRRAVKNSSAKIVSPGGMINFHSNILESAFARISFVLQEEVLDASMNLLKDSKIRKAEDKVGCPDTPESSRLKRKRSEGDGTSNKKRNEKVTSTNKASSEIESPTKEACKYTRTKRQLFRKADSSGVFVNNSGSCSSPPFIGFDNSAIKSKICDSYKNSVKLTQVFDEESKRLLQEKADLEFARKLQEEYNKSYHYSTRSRIGKTRSSKRQVTLDEIITNSYKVK